jgi:hypothetical protein
MKNIIIIGQIIFIGIVIDVIPAISQSTVSNEKYKSSLKFYFEGGINLSHLIVEPSNNFKYDISYKTHYLPGSNLIGFIEICYNRIGIATGFGYKSLNLNFEDKINSTAYNPNVTKAFLRFKYWIMPLKVKFDVLPKDRLFLIMAYELTWLINDLSFKENYTGTRGFELYDRFDPQINFINFGIGRSIKKNMNLIFQTSFTTSNDYGKIEFLEGDYDRHYTNSKRLIEFRLGFTYLLFLNHQ